MKAKDLVPTNPEEAEKLCRRIEVLMENVEERKKRAEWAEKEAVRCRREAIAGERKAKKLRRLMDVALGKKAPRLRGPTMVEWTPDLLDFVVAEFVEGKSVCDIAAQFEVSTPYMTRKISERIAADPFRDFLKPGS